MAWSVPYAPYTETATFSAPAAAGDTLRVATPNGNVVLRAAGGRDISATATKRFSSRGQMPVVELVPAAGGWSPDNVRGRATAEAHLARIAEDPEAFLASLDDRAPTATIELPDGTIVPRLPGFVRWIWDGDLVGSINLRWQPGTGDLPPHVTIWAGGEMTRRIRKTIPGVVLIPDLASTIGALKGWRTHFAPARAG